MRTLAALLADSVLLASNGCFGTPPSTSDPREPVSASRAAGAESGASPEGRLDERAPEDAPSPVEVQFSASPTYTPTHPPRPLGPRPTVRLSSWATSSLCGMDADAHCITSPRFPNNYSIWQSCWFYITDGPALLNVSFFNTEENDRLKVDDNPYSGTHGPDGVLAFSSLSFYSGRSGVAPGWSLCLERVPPHMQYTAYPTASPTVAPPPTAFPTDFPTLYLHPPTFSPVPIRSGCVKEKLASAAFSTTDVPHCEPEGCIDSATIDRTNGKCPSICEAGSGSDLWFRADLAEARTVCTVVVYESWSEDLQYHEVWVGSNASTAVGSGNTMCSAMDAILAEGSAVRHVTHSGCEGKHVFVYLPGPDRFISLEEVVVFTASPGSSCACDTSAPTAGPTAHPCAGGPLPGTRRPHADYTLCNQRGTGDVCTPRFNCTAGFAVPTSQSSFILQCRDDNFQYDGSAVGNCEARKCTTALGGLPGANYSDCIMRHSGQECTPRCAQGYSPTGVITLACFDAQIWGREEFVFDVGGVGCAPNNCTAGPAPGTVHAAVDPAQFTSCRALSTGQSCSPAGCARHMLLSAESFELLCLADGTFDVSALQCEPNTRPSCSGGPLPGTASEYGFFATCNDLRTGDVCGIPFRCPTGYNEPAGQLEMKCDSHSLMYNASAAGRCTPKQCHTPLNVAPLTNYDVCIGKATGDTCRPQCPEGFSPNATVNLTCSDLQLSGRTQYVYDTGGAACAPNDCHAAAVTNVLSAGLASIDLACDQLVTGEQCSYLCMEGYRPVYATSSFKLTCAVNGSFTVPELLCTAMWDGAVAPACSSGPLPGTASADAVLAGCNSLVSGQRCIPEYNCSIGYRTPQVDFVLNCDESTNRYNASPAVPCIPKRCTAALGQPDSVADYSVCYSKHTGEQCIPACTSDGYSPTASFDLVCSDVFLGSRVEYVFDVAGVGCSPNKCDAGPLPGSDADFTACLSNHTGQSCLPTCPVGFTLSPGELQLTCSRAGTFDASRWSCLPPPPPPPPPGVCTPGACENGEVRADCSCECRTHWGGPACSICREPYRMHLDCSLPSVSSVSVDIGAAPPALFNLSGFLGSVAQHLSPASGSPQVTFVCVLPPGQKTITEALRQSGSCCRQKSPTQLCTPTAANGLSRRAGPTAPLDVVLDLEFVGAASQKDPVDSIVSSAAASVGFEVNVEVIPVCGTQQRCKGTCVDPRGHCSYRGAAIEVEGDSCVCQCDEYFAGDRCERCERTGTTLCFSSVDSLSVAAAAQHTVDVGTSWSPPPECSCQSPQVACEAFRCATRPAQGAHAGGDSYYPACAKDNSTVRCDIHAADLRPARSLLFIETPSGPEPRDAQGEAANAGMLPLTFVGEATELSVTSRRAGGDGRSLCGRTHDLTLLDVPTNWTSSIAAVDSLGTTVGRHFDTIQCVPFEVVFMRLGVLVPQMLSHFSMSPQCTGGIPQCRHGALCSGVLAANGVMAVLGLTEASSYDARIEMHAVAGSLHFSSPLSCEFTLRVLPGEAAQLAVDSRAGHWDWPVLQDKLFPPLVIRVMDVHGNTCARDAAGTAQAAPARVSVWITDAEDDSVFTPDVTRSDVPRPVRLGVSSHLDDRAVDARGMAVFNIQLVNTAYGRAYALHFALQRIREPGGESGRPLKVELPLPRCPGGQEMAVYGRGRCIPCPAGLECDGGHRTRVLPGFWRAAAWDYRPVRCPHPSNCVGAANQTANLTSTAGLAGFPAGSEALCKEGADGPLCAQCSPGWRLAEDRQGRLHCDECGDRAYPYIAAAHIFLVCAFILLITWVKLPYTLQRTGRTGQMIRILIEILQIAGVLTQVPVVTRAMVGISQLMSLLNFDQDLALWCTLPTVSYRTGLALHGVLPFLMVPIVVIAELLVKQVRRCRASRMAGKKGDSLSDEVELELNQQVLPACSGCTAWDCMRCETCRDTRCKPCLRTCVLEKHSIVPVPLMGEGCRLQLPLRYELVLGAMIGSFLALPTMMKRFAERWQCVTFTLAESGGNCSAQYPEDCSTESRLQADIDVLCSDPATAALSISGIVGWGGVAAALLCVALSHAAARKTVTFDRQADGADGGPSGSGKESNLDGAGLHSAVAVGAWGPAYYAYRKPCWWWESYILVWKSLIFICFVLRLHFAFFSCTLLCFVGMALHLIMRPYHDKFVLCFSVVGHGLLTSAMLAALWLSSAETDMPIDDFDSLDMFTQGTLVVVGVCSVAVLLGVALLFLKIVVQAVPLARQLYKSGEATDADVSEPEAAHVAKIMVRLMGAPPKRLTYSALEIWRARYAADIPPLVREQDLENLASLFATLLNLATAGPFGELLKELRSAMPPSDTEKELARRGRELLLKHGGAMPGLGAIELLVLELYTMEGPDIDGTVGFDAPRWREFEELEYSAQAVEVALEHYKKETEGGGQAEPSLPEGSDAALKAEVKALLDELRGGLYDEIMAAQAAYKKYKEEVGDTRNPSLYRPVCAALRFVQSASAGSAGGKDLLKALDQVVKQGFLNVIMVLMYAARPVPELLCGEATLWRGLADLPATVHRWHRLLKPGDFIGWAPPTSTSFDKDAAFGFATGARSVIFCIRGVLEGVPLWCLSRYPQERELLLPPFARLRVEGVSQGPPLQITLRWLGSYRGRISAIAEQRVAADDSKMLHWVPGGPADAAADAEGPCAVQAQGATESESAAQSETGQHSAEEWRHQYSVQSTALQAPPPPLPPGPVGLAAGTQPASSSSSPLQPSLSAPGGYDHGPPPQGGRLAPAVGPLQLPAHEDPLGPVISPALQPQSPAGGSSGQLAVDVEDINPETMSPMAFAPEGAAGHAGGFAFAPAGVLRTGISPHSGSPEPLLGGQLSPQPAAASPPPAAAATPSPPAQNPLLPL
eukprot:TRINITY_DN593_c0_g3_i1.p1 TRINITY_DN593_c0_g3~~TRINITY_DN593_c0_g3_i1.p1  ORF type:complete len:2882 (+),score=256.09 TRINITY_DN593_c0_g3_i1:90-8735(+)